MIFSSLIVLERKRNSRSYNQSGMELQKVIAELRAERAAIDEALAALDRIAHATGGKRRGRPPAWLTAKNGPAAPAESRKKRVLSAEVRKKMAESQKKRWAAYHKEHSQ